MGNFSENIEKRSELKKRTDGLWHERQGDEDKPCGASPKDVQLTIRDSRDDSWAYILRKYKNQKDMTGPISKDESKC